MWRLCSGIEGLIRRLGATFTPTYRPRAGSYLGGRFVCGPDPRNGPTKRRKDRAIGVRPIAVEFYPQTHGQDDRATSESAVQKINGHWYQSDKPVGAILVGWAIKHKIVISTEQVQILRELLAIVGLRHSQA